MAGPLEFASKQSDYWFIEETDEFLVCTVTSVSADFDGCYGDKLISIYPMLHKINRKTNKTDFLFPRTTSISAISTNDTYVYSTVPDISSNIAIEEISKPIISYNEKTDYYNVTFLGKYTDKDINIFTYNFQYADGLMHLLESHVLVPESKNPEAKFTFEDGYIHKDYTIDGITTAGFNSNLGLLFPYFSGGEIPPNYKIRPWHENNNLVFSKAIYSTISTKLEGNSALPMGYSGGYITQKSSAKALESDGVMRIEFTYKCFNLEENSQSNTLIPFVTGAWGQVNNDPISAARGIATAGQSINADNYGEGFCVFLYEPNTEEFPVHVIADDSGISYNNIDGIGTKKFISDPDNNELVLNGYGSGIGYSPASATYLENTDSGPNQFRVPGIKAKGYVGICFDISGLFCTTKDGKPGAFPGTGLSTAINTSFRKTIGVRGGYRQKYQALFRSSTITDIDLHEVVTAYSNATSKDIRIDIRNGTDVRIYGKLSTSNTWKSLYNFNLSNLYDRVPKFLKAGLSFSTSDKVSNFELQKFRVQGIQSDTPSIPDVVTSGSPVSPPNEGYNTIITGGTGSCSSDISQLCDNYNSC